MTAEVASVEALSEISSSTSPEGRLRSCGASVLRSWLRRSARFQVGMAMVSSGRLARMADRWMEPSMFRIALPGVDRSANVGAEWS